MKIMSTWNLLPGASKGPWVDSSKGRASRPRE